jgi:integrase
MDIDNGRPIRHVSEDLGHASVAITEQIYVNADANAKFDSGFAREI